MLKKLLALYICLSIIMIGYGPAELNGNGNFIFGTEPVFGVSTNGIAFILPTGYTSSITFNTSYYILGSSKVTGGYDYMYLLPGSPTPVWEDSSEWKEYWAEGWDGYYRQVLVDISGTAVPLYLMWPNGSASYVYAGSISNFLMPTFVVQEYTNGAISSSTFSGLTRVVSSTTLSNPGQYVQPTAQPPSAQPPSAQPPSTEPSKIDVSSSVPTVDISAPDTGEYIKVTAPYSAPGETKRYRVSVGSSNYNNSSLLESTTDASVYYYVPSTARGERLYFWVDYDYSTSYTGHTSYVRTGYVFGYISGTTSNVSGSTACGSRLSSSGLPSGTSSYQWQRSANGVSGWSNVSGATNYYYDTQAADTSYFFRVEYGADTSNYYYGSIT